MPNILNVTIHKEYEALLGGNLDALFVQPLGMTVAADGAFRGKLAESNLRMQVLKGALALRVLEARGLSNVGPIFAGPVAVIVAEPGKGVDSAAVAASKVVSAWRKAKSAEFPVIKGGLLEGSVLGAAEAVRLEKMPGKREVQARIAAQILAPGARLNSQIRAAGGRIAGALKAHIENLEKQAPQA
jgi:large subunit ribosomal protein L10